MEYVLRGKEVIEEPNLLKWAKWFEKASRRVAITKTKHAKVSTVFLGLDHSFGDSGSPLVFETMVFNGKLNGEMERCCTWDDAIQSHYKMVKKVRKEEG